MPHSFEAFSSNMTQKPTQDNSKFSLEIESIHKENKMRSFKTLADQVAKNEDELFEAFQYMEDLYYAKWEKNGFKGKKTSSQVTQDMQPTKEDEKQWKSWEGYGYNNGWWNNGNYVQGNKYGQNVKAVTPVKPHLAETINLNAHYKTKDHMRPVKVVFSGLCTAKFFIMMQNYPNIEWGVYLKYTKSLPDASLLSKTMMQDDSPYEIHIDDFLLIPQRITTGHVSFEELDFPEMMTEVFNYKFTKEGETKVYTSGRVHSHHNIGEFHSGTDNGELLKAMEIGDKIISTVIAWDKKYTKYQRDKIYEKGVTVENFDKLFDLFNYDSKLAIPKHNLPDDLKALVKKGAYVELENSFFRYNADDISEAVTFLKAFDDMIDYVEQFNTPFKVISKFAKDSTINPDYERDLRNIITTQPIVSDLVLALIEESMSSQERLSNANDFIGKITTPLSNIVETFNKSKLKK